MTLYHADKQGMGFYIQAHELTAYAELGYRITKYVEVEVDDVQAEQEAAVAEMMKYMKK